MPLSPTQTCSPRRRRRLHHARCWR